MPHRHPGKLGHQHEGDVLIRAAGVYGIAMRVWGRRGRRWRTELTARLQLRPGDRVLDVASGTGDLAFELARRVVPGGSVDGIDAANEMVDKASATSRRLGLPVTFHIGRAQQLPFADSTYAAVTCTLALHHIAREERLQAVGEMRRVLQPGGRLLIADVQQPSRRLPRFLAGLLCGHAMAERPLDQATDLLRSAGFDDVTRSDTSASWIGVVVGTRPR